MTDLSAFAELSARDHGLVVLNTLRGDGSIQSSVVNAGVMPHPTTGDPVVALVAISLVFAVATGLLASIVTAVKLSAPETYLTLREGE